MLYATVMGQPFDAIFFVCDNPGQDEGWEVEEGVEIDIPSYPFELLHWPEGAERPTPTLCRALENPKRFKVYKYQADVDRSRYRPTNKQFGGVFSKESWEGFIKSLRADQTIWLEENQSEGLPGDPSQQRIGGAG